MLVKSRDTQGYLRLLSEGWVLIGLEFFLFRTSRDLGLVLDFGLGLVKRALCCDINIICIFLLSSGILI